MKYTNARHFKGIGAWSKTFFWRRQSIYGGLLLALLSLVVWQLSVIPPNAALVEVEYTSASSSLRSIIENPLSLPHKLVTYVSLSVSDSVRVVRAVSIIILGLAVVSLYRILKRWHSDHIALFSSALFASNAMVLSVGRLGTPLVLLFCWSFLIAVVLWLLHGKSRHFAPAALLLASALLLYVPGALYFLLLFGLTYINKIKGALILVKRSSFYGALAMSIFLLSPLIWALARNTELLRQWLLLPSTISWGQVPANILQVPSAFIYRAPDNALLNVGQLPILDVAAGGLFLVGLYAYQKNVKLERTRFMIITSALAILLGALGQVTAAIVIVLPYAFIVIAAGISYLLDQWYAVFPRNPFAKSFGFALVSLVVILSMYYQLYRFFVVWPQTPETRAVYDQVRLVE